ncbi:MAG: ABC transporter permease [Actinobacteria bacterium]|nr:ABC transporter permease [Actinomycetota bacterium]
MSQASAPAGPVTAPEERSSGRVEDRRGRSCRDAKVTALALVLAFAIGAVIIAVSNEVVLEAWGNFGNEPLRAVEASFEAVGEAYGALFEGALFDPGAASVTEFFAPISETAVAATPLIASGLAVTLAFRSGLFNIGGEGQAILGAAASAYVGFHFGLPPVIHLFAALLAATLAGAAWGFVPGYLKVRTGAHEVITTIMLNYVAGLLVVYLLTMKAFERVGRSAGISPLVAGNARLPELFGGGLRVNAGLILVLCLAWVVWWLLFRTTLGYGLRAVGQNRKAARSGGIDVGATVIGAMSISGALAGLAGACTMLGTDFALSSETAAGLGFAGISVALLGRATVKGTVAAGFLFGALQAGSIQMQAATGTSADLVTVIEALIVLTIAAPLLMARVFRLRAGDAGVSTTSGGWSA